MKLQFLVAGIVAAISVGGPPRARGGTVYSQPAVNGLSGFASGFTEQQFIADNFSLSAAANVAAIHFWGNYSGTGVPSAPPAFRLRLYNAGSPIVNPTAFQDVALTDVTRSPTALLTGSSIPIFEFTANLPASVALSGSTTYYASLVDNTTDRWFWASSGPGTLYFRTTDSSTDPWISSGVGNVAFELLDSPFAPNAVPLPTTVAAGLILLAFLSAGRLVTARGSKSS